MKELTGFILIVCILVGCNNPEKEWNRANKQNSREAYANYLELYPNSQFSDEARRRFEAMIKEEIYIKMAQGFFHLSKNELSQAEESFSDILVLSRNNPFALNNLAVIAAFGNSDFAKAKELLETALTATSDQTISKKICLFAFSHNGTLEVMKAFLPADNETKPPQDGPNFQYFSEKLAFWSGSWVCVSVDHVGMLDRGIKSNIKTILK